MTSVPRTDDTAENGPRKNSPQLSGLLLVAKVLMDRPGFGGAELTPSELAAGRPGWVLGLLAEFAPLRSLVRSLWPQECSSLVSMPVPSDSDEALCRLMLHADRAVRDTAALSVTARPAPGPLPAPPGSAAEAPGEVVEPVNKRLRNLERRLEQHQERRRRAEGKLKYVREERDRAQRAQRLAEEGRAEAVAETEQARTEVALLRSEHRDPRALGRRLARLWETSPNAASDDPRERDSVPCESPERGALRNAAERAGLGIDLLLGFLRALVHPGPPEVSEERERPAVSVGEDRAPKVVQLGGGTEIGGSCVLVQAGDTRILVDAGLRQGGPGESSAPPGLAALAPGPLSAVVVTHAHNDHAGYVPRLLAERGPFPVVSTPVTTELMPTMWTDAAKVARLRDSGNGAPSDSSYGLAEVQRAAAALVPLPVGTELAVGDLTVELFPSGHLVGAAGVVVRAGEHRVVVTGDISDFDQASVGPYSLPASAVGADLLVVESTCCDLETDDRSATVSRMLDTVAGVCGAGGRVLVPAMSLGRAQEVALLLRAGLPDVPVLIDGMARTISDLVEQATAGDIRPIRVLGDNVRGVSGGQRSRLVETFRGGVVISPAGSLAGGPVVAWARAVLPDPNSAVLVAGRQDGDSSGRRLTSLSEGPDRRLVLPGRSSDTVEVRARVVDTRLSAHADQRGLLRVVEEVGADRVRLVHGVERAQRVFGRILSQRGYTWEVGTHGR